MSRRSKQAWSAAILLAAAAVTVAASQAGEEDYASRIGIFYKCLSIRNPGTGFW